jgi:hypothetical protein
MHSPQVSFVVENGIDAGGLTREWFSLVSSALLGARVLRRTEHDSAFEYYLNPLAQAEEDTAQAEFIGGFLAKALLETAVPERAARHGLVALGSLRLCTVLCAPSLASRMGFTPVLYRISNLFCCTHSAACHSVFLRLIKRCVVTTPSIPGPSSDCSSRIAGTSTSWGSQLSSRTSSTSPQASSTR